MLRLRPAGWWGKQIAGELKSNTKLRVAKTVDAVPPPANGRSRRALSSRPITTPRSPIPTLAEWCWCTPHTLHMQQIVAAAKAKKNVFCEKPLTMNRREVLTAIAACKENGVALAVGHEHRFKPALQDVLKMVKSGELGTVQMIEGASTFMLRPLPPDNWRVQKAESPGGPSMVALGIHALDMCVAVAGAAVVCWPVRARSSARCRRRLQS